MKKYPIYEKLSQLNKSDYYPFHMPGHKRKKQEIFSRELFEHDITEITGFDDMHQPDGIIKESMDYIKSVYGTKESYFLINSSTGGILAAISSVCNIGDTILISRNCHKSVYHAIQLLNLCPIYIYPKIIDGICKGITKEEVEEALQEKVKAVVIVSPTYEGNVSEIKAISKVLREQEIPLIVDEAHGAHFIYHNAFPQSAVSLGADIVIQSLHKTLPSLTQTGLLHLNGDLVSKEKVEEYLGIYQSSSPSYVLMSSIDYCVRICDDRRDFFHHYVRNIERLRQQLQGMQVLKLLKSDDIGKIVISTSESNITGEELFKKLRNEYHLELEMAELTYVIAMTSVFDEERDLKRLEQALLEIDQKLVKKKREKKVVFWTRNEIIDSPGKAKEKRYKRVSIREAIQQESANYIYLYPPGIPLVTPGEKIGEEIIMQIEEYLHYNMKVVGIKDQKISVIDERK